MGEVTVVWWRDIPAQVLGGRGRDATKIVLSDRFQEAIDTAATRVGVIGTDDYLAEWKREKRTVGDDVADAATALAQRFEDEFDDERLNELAANGGFAS
jgi:cvfA/B/C family virulence factor